MNAANIIASFIGGFTLYNAYRLTHMALTTPLLSYTCYLPVDLQRDVINRHRKLKHSMLRWSILLFVLGTCQLIIAPQL